MSSLPHPKGVADVIGVLSRVESLEAEAARLQPEAKRLCDRLREVDKLLVDDRRRLSELLESMDVEEPGNNGWDRRMGWFLAEMRRQILSGPNG